MTQSRDPSGDQPAAGPDAGAGGDDSGGGTLGPGGAQAPVASAAGASDRENGQGSASESASPESASAEETRPQGPHTESAAPERPSVNQSLDARMRPEVLQISDVMRRWRVLIGRRIISRRAIANVDPRIDLSHVDVLDVVRQLQQDSEATVGGVARAMRIDPSRGSRIIADMVEEGLLLRDVSAQDSRRAVIRRSELGEALQAELRKVKMALLEDILGEWAPGEAEEFARLFAKFVAGMERASADSGEGCGG